MHPEVRVSTSHLNAPEVVELSTVQRVKDMCDMDLLSFISHSLMTRLDKWYLRFPRVLLQSHQI